MKTRAGILVGLVVLAAVGAAQADFVSLNLYKDFAGQQISGGETFGSTADSTVTDRWSNHNGNGWNTTQWNNLSLGTAGISTVGYTVSGGGGYAAGGFGAINTAMKAGRANYTGSGANLATLTFTNINANFTGSYDAIVYLAGHTAASQGAITDGTTTYYFNTPDSASSALTLVTDTNPGDGYSTGTYVKFTGLTADTFSVQMSIPDTNWIAIGGAQLVGTAVPEPATLGLIGLFGGGILFIRRRFMI